MKTHSFLCILNVQHDNLCGDSAHVRKKTHKTILFLQITHEFLGFYYISNPTGYFQG